MITNRCQYVGDCSQLNYVFLPLKVQVLNTCYSYIYSEYILSVFNQAVNQRESCDF